MSHIIIDSCVKVIAADFIAVVGLWDYVSNEIP